MEDPKGNYIDIIKYEKIKRIPLIRKESVRRINVCRIGFPNWTSFVSRVDIKKVRQAAKLDDEHDIDSQVFFKGLEPLETLIAKYQEPLRELADR